MSFSFTVAQRENRSAFLSDHGVIIRLLLLLLFTLYIIYYTRHNDDAVVSRDIGPEQVSLCSVYYYYARVEKINRREMAIKIHFFKGSFRENIFNSSYHGRWIHIHLPLCKKMATTKYWSIQYNISKYTVKSKVCSVGIYMLNYM